MMDPMSQILQELRLSAYEKNFRDEEIKTLEDLRNLSLDDIKEIGVTKVGDRNRLLQWINTQNSQPVVEVDANNGDSSNASITTTVVQQESAWPLPNVHDILDDIDGVSFEHKFNEAVCYIKDDELFCYVPERSACHQGSHAPLFNYLYIDADIVQRSMTTLVGKEIAKMTSIARESGLNVSVVNHGGSIEYVIGKINVQQKCVIDTAMRLHEMIIHRYSYLNATEEPPSDEDTKVLTVFRKASLSLAVQVSLISEVTQKSENEVIRAFMDNSDPAEDCDPAEDATSIDVPDSPQSSDTCTALVPFNPLNAPSSDASPNTLIKPANKFKIPKSRILRMMVGAVGAEVGKALILCLLAL